MFSTFSVIASLLAYVRVKKITQQVLQIFIHLYALNAHYLKCNVSLLTPDKIIFCLADTKIINLRIPVLVYNFKKSFRIRTKIKTKMIFRA